MSSSGISDLSSVESIETDEEILSGAAGAARPGSLDHYFKNAKEASTAPRKKRPASPPHEYVLADTPDIAFIVMFRARFSSAFPRSVPHLGPQDIENGVVNALPDEGVEKLLCALIGLVLNRKKDVERGHYQRALEEAVQTNNHQWPTLWDGKNPLRGGSTFNSMTPQQRLSLLKALILWALNSSETIQGILKESYKQQRHEDDLNQPLSVQAWGKDGDKRWYWLVEGQDDTHFRLYRESNHALKTNTWWSVADSIENIRKVAEKLKEDGSQAARKLSERIMQAIPRFEAGEEKRKRRDYRIARKAQFRRPEPGFSLYEGRTRGKRIRYTFSDDDDDDDRGSDEASSRHSKRQSGISTPAEPAGPTFTASGRQVRSRHGGLYGKTILSGQPEALQAPAASQTTDSNGLPEDENTLRLRSRRPGRPRGSGHRSQGPTDGFGDSEAMDEDSDDVSSENEWNEADDDDEDDDQVDDGLTDDDDEMLNDNESVDNDDSTGKQSLVVALRYSKESAATVDRLSPSNPDPHVTASNGTSMGTNGESKEDHGPTLQVKTTASQQVNGSEENIVLESPGTQKPPDHLQLGDPKMGLIQQNVSVRAPEIVHH